MAHFLISICIAVFVNVAFSQSIRFSQVRKANPYAFAVINYLVCATVFLAWAFIRPAEIDISVIAAGAFCGIIYGVTFFLILYCMHHAGVGKTATTMNLSQAIAILASIFIWGEKLSIITGLGVVLAGVSIPLILLGAAHPTQKVHRPAVIALTVFFFTQGSVFTVFKWFERLGDASQRPAFLATLFVTASVITIGVAICKRVKIKPADLGCGFMIGSFNTISNLMMLYCLTLASAGVVFSTVTASAVAATALTSMWLWAERYPTRVWAGMAIAVVAVILINL